MPPSVPFNTETRYSFARGKTTSGPCIRTRHPSGGDRMRIALTPEQERLKAELREYFAELVTPEVRTALSSSTGEFGDTEAYKAVIRRIGQDGWLGIGWP